MPVSLPEAVSFIGLAIGLALVPGPNLAVVLRNAAKGGQRAAWATAAGLTSSKTVWAIASMAGLAQILQSSAQAFVVLRLVGGLYLVYLGISTLRGRGEPATPGSDESSIPPPKTSWWAFRAGALSDVLNPKVGAFYLAVFPHYIEVGDPLVATAAFLLVLHTLVLMTYYPAAAFLTLRVRSVGRRSKQMDNAIGVGLVGAGVVLALSATDST